MRVTGSTFNFNLNKQLQNLNSEQYKLLNQISTGQKILKISDDPAAGSRIINIQHEKRELSQFSRNADQAESISQVSNESLRTINDLNVRAQEIASLTNSGINASGDMLTYATEVDHLIEQAISTSNSQYLDNYLFSGTQTKTAPVTETRDADGKITAATYAGGTTDSASQSIGKNIQIKPYQDHSENEKLVTMINDLITLRDALEAGDPSAVSTSQASLSDNEDNLINMMGSINANLLRIETTSSQDADRFRHLEAQISKDADVDLADAITKLQSTQTSLQAAMQSASKVLRQSLLDYI